MPKQLTKMQERIVADTLASSQGPTFYYGGGPTQAIANMRHKGLVKDSTYYSVTIADLMPQAVEDFFYRPDDTFFVHGLARDNQIIFDNRKFLLSPWDEGVAARVVAGLKLLAKSERNGATDNG